MNIILSTCKIPHKITSIHIAKLIAKHKLKIFTKSGSSFTVFWNSSNSFVHFFCSRIYHSWNKSFVFVGIIRYYVFVFVYNNILAIFLFIFRLVISVWLLSILRSFKGIRIVRVIENIGISVLFALIVG